MSRTARPTTDEVDYLAAILRDPGDDMLRVVYADILEEAAGEIDCPSCLVTGEVCCCGQPRSGSHDHNSCGPPEPCSDCADEKRVSNGKPERAEFIRVQLEILRLRMQGTPGVYRSEEPDAPEKLKDLYARESELLSEHWWKWVPESMFSWSRGWGGYGGCHYRNHPTNGFVYRFERGFVWRVNGTLGQLLRHVPTLLETHPVSSVVPSDTSSARMSMPWAGFGGMGSAWIFNDETNLSGSALPRKLRPFMPIRIDAGKHGDERFVMYDGDQPLGAVSYWATDKDAEDVLSHTILGYARHVNATKAVAPV